MNDDVNLLYRARPALAAKITKLWLETLAQSELPIVLAAWTSYVLAGNVMVEFRLHLASRPGHVLKSLFTIQSVDLAHWDNFCDAEAHHRVRKTLAELERMAREATP